jgi:EmrB/QacA subfamily drug resistance transporter
MSEHDAAEVAVPSKVVWAIVAVALLGFVGILTETSMNVTFPDLSKQFGLELGTIQWLTTGYLLVVSLMMTTSSFFNATFSDRKVYALAMTSFMAGNILAMLAPNFELLLLGRLIQAIGTGLAIPLMVNIVLRNVPASHLGQWMGFASLILSLAPALGPTYGGAMASLISWRGIFIGAIPVALVSIIIGLRVIDTKKPIARDGEKQSFDVGRFLILGVALTSSLLALNQIEQAGFTGWFFGLALVAILGGWLFIRQSRHATKKFLNLAVFKVKPMVYALITYAIVQALTLGVNFVVPQYAQLSVGTSTLVAGLILMPGSIVGALINPYYGRLYDRFGAKWLGILGNAGFVLTFVVFAVFANSLTAVAIAVLYTTMTISRNPVFSSMNTAGMSEVALQDQADANAIFNTSQQFAGAVGTAVGSLFIKTTGTTAAAISHETMIGTRNYFIFSIVVAALLFLSIRGFLRTKTTR